MTNPYPQQPYQQGPPPPAPAPQGAAGKKRKRWPMIVGGALLFFVGVGIGSAGGGEDAAPAPAAAPAAEPAETADTGEVDDLKAELAAAESALAEAEQRAQDAEGRSAELDQRAAELDAREAAVTQTEAQFDANNLSPGKYIVGTDIEPGVYRTVNAVTGLCYVGQDNGNDIMWNDISNSGQMVATVENVPGSTFEFDSSCGTMQKVG
jgi:hypothetical protein